MTIQEILKKIAAGETLTAEEIEFVKKNQGESDEGNDKRIPKERLDKEIKKRQEAEESAKKLNEQIEELKTKLEELETNGMSEAEKAKAASDKEIAKLKKQVDELTKAGEEAKTKAATLERNAKIRELASSRKFRNAEFLDFKLKSANIDLEDEDAVGKFFGELEKSSPELFDSNSKSGTGTQGNQQGGNDGNSVNLARLDELRKKPDFTQAEAAEFIKLSEQQQKAEESANNNSNNK